MELVADPDIDVVVELIGGEEGVAKDAVEAALKAGKHVVTANKALLAHHGAGARGARREHGVALKFEARCGRRHSHRQGAARKPARLRHLARVRHPERHLQFHPDHDGERRAGHSPRC